MEKHRAYFLNISFFVFVCLYGIGFAESPKELINEAHQYDVNYNLGPEASASKALDLYNKALQAKPDAKQKLHILYRMAQLNGSAYRLDKGEKPNYPEAIRLYKEIVKEYPQNEPLVLKSMQALGDHFTTLRDFENALTWQKKILNCDTASLKEQIASLEQQIAEHVPPKRSFSRNDGMDSQAFLENEEIDAFSDAPNRLRDLRKQLQEIQKYQITAVDQVTYTADRIGYVRTHGELRAISEKHPNPLVADRAAQRLIENMDKMPQLWAPPLEDFPSSGPSVKALNRTPAVIVQNPPPADKFQDKIPGDVPSETKTVTDTSLQKPQTEGTPAKPRYPPYFLYAGMLLGITALIARFSRNAIKKG